MRMVIELILASFAAMGFATIYNAPKPVIVHTGLVGACGWLVYMLVMMRIDSVIFAIFAASLTVTLISRKLAIRKKTPVTVFLIAGIIPFVPGVGIYNTMYEIINKSPAASAKAVETFEIAGVITLGIMIAFSLPIKDRRKMAMKRS